MSRDPGLLDDILREARLALTFVAEMTETDFSNDKKTQHAVVRCLEIIGEAANNLSEDTRRHLADLPWADIIGQRHVAIHHYNKVRMPLVWATVHEDLPPLIAAIEAFSKSAGLE
jgi:uncharacterized protein with HEPN domain